MKSELVEVFQAPFAKVLHTVCQTQADEDNNFLQRTVLSKHYLLAMDDHFEGQPLLEDNSGRFGRAGVPRARHSPLVKCSPTRHYLAVTKQELIKPQEEIVSNEKTIQENSKRHRA